MIDSFFRQWQSHTWKKKIRLQSPNRSRTRDLAITTIPVENSDIIV